MVSVGEATAPLADTGWKPRGASCLDLIARSHRVSATGFIRGESFRPTVERVPQQSEQPAYRYVLVTISYLSPPKSCGQSEALALAETDLDRQRGAVLVRAGRAVAGGRSGWTAGRGSNSITGSSCAGPCQSARCSAFCVARPAAGHAPRPRSVASCTGPRWPPEYAAGSRPTIKPTCSICRRRRPTSRRLGARRLEIGITRAAPIVVVWSVS